MPQTVTIFHGSQFIIKKPVHGEGNPHNDYGSGFYCTHEIELAKEWACLEDSGGYANQYDLELTGLSVMYLSGEGYNILNWLAILLANRIFRISNDIAAEGKAFLIEKFLPDISAFDVIIGYRADDSYFSFANAFLNNTLSLTQLKKAMYLGNLGEQTVLKSKKAFEQISYIRSENAECEIYYPRRTARDMDARLSYRRERVIPRAVDSIYLMDILRERWSGDDARI